MRSRLRIGYVYRDFNGAGSIASFFRDRAERLAQDEDVVAICSARTREPTSARIEFVTVEPLVRSRRRFGYAVECASFALRASRRVQQLRSRLDVVHVVGFDALEADMVTVNAVRPAEVEHYFAHVEPQARARRRFAPLLRPQTGLVELLERRLFSAPFPLCLTETRAVADDLVRHYAVPRELIEVIPAGVDAERFRFDPAGRARTRTELGVSEDAVAVLFVGDSFERKGLVRAIQAVARAGGSPQLWIVGGDEAAPYRKLARSLGCLDSIRFLGRVEHEKLPALYSGADVVVLPSRQDAWGQPILEALACGRVVIVSEWAGAREVVRSGSNGFVVAGAGEPEEIAALLEGPATDPDVRARIAVTARSTAALYDRGLLYQRLRQAHHHAYELRLARSRAST